MTSETKAAIKVMKELRLNGAVARLTRARKTHKCHACEYPIEPGKDHYCIYYGKGLGSLKFPDRVHIQCIDKYLNQRR